MLVTGCLQCHQLLHWRARTVPSSSPSLMMMMMVVMMMVMTVLADAAAAAVVVTSRFVFNCPPTTASYYIKQKMNKLYVSELQKTNEAEQNENEKKERERSGCL
jgi:P pilus assembly chaperone PapD